MPDAAAIGQAIREARSTAGRSQTEVAAAAGVGRQWLVRLERGHEGAALGKVLRVLDELGLAPLAGSGHDAPRRMGPWMTAPDLTEAVGAELRRGDTTFALRLLARAVADLRSLHELSDLDRFLGEPASTGDRRWDTLVAAAVSRECRLRGVVAPRWTDVQPLGAWWFPDDDPVVLARTMQRTPVDLRVKGIWLDGAALESR